MDSPAVSINKPPLLPSPSKKSSNSPQKKIFTSPKVKIPESQLPSEFQILSQVLKTKSQEDWSKRSQALVVLQAHIQTGISDYESFLPNFNRSLREPISEQVNFF